MFIAQANRNAKSSRGATKHENDRAGVRVATASKRRNLELPNEPPSQNVAPAGAGDDMDVANYKHAAPLALSSGSPSCL